MRSLYSRPSKNGVHSIANGSLAKFVLLIAVVGAVLATVYVKGETAERTTPGKGITLNLAPHAKQLHLQQPSLLSTNYRGDGAQALGSGTARPIGLATADLNLDGAPDLITSYSSGLGGWISVQRGNVDAFAPKKQEFFDNAAKGIVPATFSDTTDTIALPEAPDFVLSGDFNGDGNPDLLTAARGGSALHMLAGNGQGTLAPVQSLAVDGAISTINSGAFAYTGTTGSILVGLSGSNGPVLQVYTTQAGEHWATPGVTFPLPASASATQLGVFDEDQYPDLAVAAGSELLIIHGDEPAHLRSDSFDPQSRIEHITLDNAVDALAVGNFVWDRDGRAEVALRSTDGSIQVWQRGQQNTTPYSDSELLPRDARGRMLIAEQFKARASAPVWQHTQNEQWARSAQFNGLTAASDRLFQTSRLSGKQADDLLYVDKGAGEVFLTSESGQNAAVTGAQLLATDSAPLAVLPLPQKFNGDRDVLVLPSDGPLSVIVQLAATFTVTKTADTNDGVCNGDCSLREAAAAANAVAGPNTINVPGNLGTYNLTANGQLVFGSATNNNTTVMGTVSTATITQTQAGLQEVVDAGPVGTVVTLSLQNVTVSGGDFGGVVAGADNGAIHSTLIVNSSTITSNSNSNATFGQGGGIFNQGGNLTVTNSTISNNTATCSTCGQGAGIFYDLPNASNPGNLNIDNTLFTGNQAAINSSFAAGAGLFTNITSVGNTSTVTDSTFTNNQATGGGHGAGEANTSNQVLVLSRNRFRGNTVTGAGTGTAFRNSGSGAVTAEQNWWGCDAMPAAAPCDTVTVNAGSGAVDTDPRIDLKFTSVPATICRGATSTVTADVTQDTNNINVNGGNAPDVLVGLTLTFANGPLGTLSAPSTDVVPVGGKVSRTFTAPAVHGSAAPTVVMDVGTAQAAPILIPNAFTSAATGNFNVATTWTPQCVPQSDDSVTIANTHTVTLPGASDIADVTINAGGTLNTSTFNLNVNSTNDQKPANYAGTNTWTNNGTLSGTGTITLNSNNAALTQTVAGTTTFNNLTTSGSATKAFGTSSNTIANTFTHGGGTMNGGTSTFTFTGNPGVIAGANLKSFFNLVIANGASVTNSTGGNVTINGDFTNNGTGIFTQDPTLTTTFAGTTHALSGTGTTSFGIVNIQGSNTVNAGSHNFTFTGATFTVTGTFNGQTGTVTAGGSVAQSILGAGTKSFNNLVINNAAGVTLSTAASVAGTATLTLTNGAFANGANLTLGNGATISRSGGTLGSAPTFTTSANVIYTAPSPAAAITTGPELPVAATVLNNLTINNPSGVNLNANAQVNGTLALTSGAFAVGTNTLTLMNGSSVGTGSLTSALTGTVVYNQGSVGQAVLPANYGNLTFSNFNKVLPNGATVGVANVFTPGTAVGHTITGNTFDFNGTGAQTVPAFNYNNLTISGARTTNNVTLINGGTIGVAGAFAPTATFAGGSYVITNNTLNYNGTGAQAVVAFNYNNLILSGAHGANNITLANTGTIGIAGTGVLTSSATFAGGSIVLTGSTVEYNGAAAQALSSTFPTYFNLSLNNAAGTTGFAGLTVQNLIEVKLGTFTSSSTYKDVLIDAGATLAAAAASTINVSGSWTNNGAFTAGTGTVNFNGASNQTIGGTTATTFNNLTNSNAAGLTFGQNETVGGVLALTSGDINTSTFTLTMPGTGTSSGAFDVVGNVKRSGFAVGTPLSFGNPFNTITIEPGSVPTDITINLVKAAPANFTTAVQRTYNITSNGAFTSLTLRLHYLDTELNSNDENTMIFRKFDGASSYIGIAPTSRDTAANWLQKTGQTSLSQWVFSSAVLPTVTSGVVTGRILDTNGAPVAGAVINLNGTQNRKTITDANGNYRFENVETAGFYTVRASRANYTFSPQERSFSQLGNQTEAAFTATLSSARVNPLDTAEYFVRQHYVDFLMREPDEAGFNFWSDQILGCGGDTGCVEVKRINVSAAYFKSIEFQKTGALVDGLYRASFDRAPQYAEFMPDTAVVGRDVVVGRSGWEQQLAANQQAFLDAFVQRQAFQAVYGGLSNQQYVDTLLSHTRIDYTAAEREALVNGLNSSSLTRAAVLGQIAGDQRFVDAKFNKTFVLMEYFGYLRRDPDAEGYQFWLNKLNQFGGNYEQADMVKAFIVSGEYRGRFQQ